MNISPLEFALTGFTALVCAVFAFAALVDVKLLTSAGGEHKFAAWRQLGVPDILARPATRDTGFPYSVAFALGHFLGFNYRSFPFLDGDSCGPYLLVLLFGGGASLA